ncbi:class I adenylate-forming enzyme family protein [Pseudonocardia pini]|uniref:class I adenylate-forming enzyme family protein n=1 Tax=Pseudonocardia pini TaxID=2758030 RepID=UPI0015F04367|nr:AMP-binding protein [Pseudonocardia pini]
MSSPGPSDVAAATGTTVDALFRRAFRIFADRVAVTSDQPCEEPWTYRELGGRAERLAAGLHASGLRRGDRVAVLSETRPEYVELYAALARLGVAVVTLNVRLHPDELAHIVGTAGPRALITSGSFAASAEAIRDRSPSVKAWYSLDPREGFLPYGSLRESGAEVPEPAAQPGDLHNVLYTSGTTGLPKGAMITQQAAAVRGLRLAQWFGLTADDGFVGWLPMFHCAGDESLYATMVTGGRFACLRKADPARILDLVERDRLSWTLLLPGVITDVLAEPTAGRDLTSFRFAIGYANMMPTVVEQLTAKYRISFCDAFGQTETSYALAHGFSGPGERPHLRKTPTPLLDVRLVDTEMNEVPVGVPGECVVRGPGVMSGYLDDPAATAEAFRGGWLHTGDVLVRAEDGTLSFVDRTKYLVKTGGENVYPAEVEHAIAGHPAVQEVCAFGVPDERWGETVKVVVVRAPGAQVSAAEIVAHCREHLASYKRPRYVEFLASEELPRSTTGKLQRHVLAERGATEAERA